MYRVINVQEIESYPDNYDWLSDQEKNIIINYLNGVQNLANRYYDQYLDELTREANGDENADVEKYLRLYNHTITSLTGSKNAYTTLGVMCEYDWPRHNQEWFLATKQDAQDYNDFYESELSEDIGTIFDISTLLHYNDVGI